jgi:hypothetical protein
MDNGELKRLLQAVLDRELLLDLEDAIKARALSAHTMIRDHAELDARRARQVEGRVRFPMQEQSFQKICLSYGGNELTATVIPGTDLKVYQPFMRFSNADEQHGVILGFAAMPDPKEVPPKNLSRRAAASLNYHVQESLDLDGKGPKLGDVYVMLLAARDRENAGMVRETAVGVVDSAYSEFLFYQDIGLFISDYSSAPTLEPSVDERTEQPLPTLRKNPKPFIPPEKGISENVVKKKQ